jgi:flagellin-like protein
MQLRHLLSDDNAVSPVIGVILMVAITVILAAVIGAFLLGLGGEQSATPQATFDIDEDDNSMVFTHGGGDTIQAPNQTLSLSGPVNDTDIESGDIEDQGKSGLTVGDTVDAELEADAENGADVRLVYSDQGSSDTATLVKHTLSDQS